MNTEFEFPERVKLEVTTTVVLQLYTPGDKVFPPSVPPPRLVVVGGIAKALLYAVCISEIACVSNGALVTKQAGPPASTS